MLCVFKDDVPRQWEPLGSRLKEKSVGCGLSVELVDM